MLNKLISRFFRHSHTPPAPTKRGSSSALVLVLLALFSLFVPQFAHADELLKLGTNNAWPIFVYGNPRVVHDILVGVSLMIDPQVGDSGFRYAMYAVSLVGFLVLAIMAGYDPAKNFIKMFTYIVMVWVVTIFTFNLKVNADVVDVLSQDGNNSYIVQNAPALAVIPMSFMFKLGNYLNNQIETAYNVPNSFKTGAPGIGTFNLFGKMAEDSSKFVITSPPLRQSLSAYAADCVIPAIARGQLSGAGKDAAKQAVTYYGTEAIIKSSDYWKTLGTAAHESILTKYYPKVADANWYASLPADIKKNLPSSDPLAMVSVSPSTGIIVPCKDAYTAMDADLTVEAESLKTQTAAQFSSTGTSTVYETIMNEFLAAASTGYQSPTSYMKQQALIDLSSETFRNAATSAGNNEVMQAVAISQAETQQKSTWGAAFHTFNNMMGYVYVVLQAFIFAITPIIILSLVVPGMGKGITGNYIQILLWLALWPPMLGVINFVITLFGIDAVKGAFSDQGGYRNLANTALISQRTNDLVLAAQFLGTMVPMISWGIIKGAMAFTEFISAGVGSQFASQAGAQAATGNYSLNNGSMNNTTLDKTSLAMSSGVGFDGVKAANAAGALDLTTGKGGTMLTASGGKVEYGRQLGESAQAAERFQQSVGNTVTSALSNAQSWGQAVDNVNATSTGTARQAALQTLAQLAQSAGVDRTAAQSISTGESTAVNRQVQAQEAGSNSTEAKGGGAVPLPGVVASYTATGADKHERSEAVAAARAAQAAKAKQAGVQNRTGTQDSVADTGSRVDNANKAKDASQRTTANHGFNQQESLQKALSLQTQRSNELQSAISESRTLSMSSDIDATRANAVLGRLEALTGSHLKSFNTLEQERLTATAKANETVATTTGHVGDLSKGVKPKEAERIAAVANAAGARAAAAAATLLTEGQVNAGVDKRTANAKKGVEDINKTVVDDTTAVAARSAAVDAANTQVAGAVADSAVPLTARANGAAAADGILGLKPPAPAGSTGTPPPAAPQNPSPIQRLANTLGFGDPPENRK